ncbi:MAG: hypothetical protein V4719_26600 [Planctomycetota bacterium]
MGASLGEFTVEDISWAGRNALTVTIATAHTDRFVQIYAGRKLVGVSNFAGQLSATGQVQPTHCPTPITVLIVDSADRATNFGSQLPRRPWNRFRIGWNAASFPTDSRWFAICASPAANEPVDYSLALARVAYLGDGSYGFELPAVNANGEWIYGVMPLDDAMPFGNAGTPAEMAVDALVYPPDVAIDENGRRLTAAIADGVLNVGFDFDWEEGAE